MSKEFLSYEQARLLLAERLQATPHEIAMWICWGHYPDSDISGLSAYSHNDSTISAPPRFSFNPASTDSDNYLRHIQRAYFKSVDIEAFTPSCRYLTYEELVVRWIVKGASEVEDKILFYMGRGLLTGWHPVTIFTQSVEPEFQRAIAGSLPPIESGLYIVSEIEAIESEDFPAQAPGDSSPQQPANLVHDKVPDELQDGNNIITNIATSENRTYVHIDNNINLTVMLKPGLDADARGAIINSPRNEALNPVQTPACDTTELVDNEHAAKEQLAVSKIYMPRKELILKTTPKLRIHTNKDGSIAKTKDGKPKTANLRAILSRAHRDPDLKACRSPNGKGWDFHGVLLWLWAKGHLTSEMEKVMCEANDKKLQNRLIIDKA